MSLYTPDEVEKVRCQLLSDKRAHFVACFGAELEYYGLLHLTLRSWLSVMHSVMTNKLFVFSDQIVQTSDRVDNHELTLVRQIVCQHLDVSKFHISR